MVKTHGKALDEESLHTLLVEVEAIVNSRPVTIETISDVKSNISLSPANLLTIKSKVILPPSGCFSSADIYCRKHWRRVQMAQRALANIARTKNVQNSKKKLSKRRYCTAESRNLSKPLVRGSHS